MSQSNALTLPDDIEIHYDRELVRRQGIAAFAKLAWPIVEPADELIWNWHHDAICEHVQAVIESDLQELAICVPPGFTKSLLVSVMASAYAWTYRPSYRILGIAYADRLAKRDNRKVRRIIQSQWYQDRWPLGLDKTDECRLENSESGFRIIGSVRAGVIGERGNLVLIDDPLSREMAESPVEREHASQFVWETLPSRMTNFKKDGKILIMQRLHGSDTAAEAKERGWEMLVLPNEFEPNTRCITSLGFQDPRKKEDELLHAERFDEDSTAKIKSPQSLGARVYAGQYQQRPAPREGNIIKIHWFDNRFRQRGEDPIRVIQSWDCASKPAERNDPSACLTIAEFKDRYEFWHYVARRQEFPDLVRHAKDRFHAEPGVNAVLIEDKDAGQQLIQQLRRDTKLPIIACNPGVLDKITRLDAETPVMEAKKCWLPESAPWVDDFLEELTTIPGAPHDESGDTTSQALKWFREKRKISTGAGIVSIGGKESARL